MRRFGDDLNTGNFLCESSMARTRRRIRSHRLYEVCFRAYEGLPFVTTAYMRLIIESVMARAQKVHPVTLSHDLWMPNHPHMFLVAKDSLQFILFIGYLKEYLTKSLKSLLGERRLSLFRDRTQISEICDLDAAVNRLIYIFTNPAAANLEATIERYPGLNSWDSLVNTKPDLDVRHVKFCPWVREPMIEPPPKWSLTERQDKFLAEKLRSKTREMHALERAPLAWIECFAPDADSEFIGDCVKRVINGVKAEEQRLSEQRMKEGRRVLGRNRLKTQSLRKQYIPKKFSKANPFIICSDNAQRVAEIAGYKDCLLYTSPSPRDPL